MGTEYLEQPGDIGLGEGDGGADQGRGKRARMEVPLERPNVLKKTRKHIRKGPCPWKRKKREALRKRGARGLI